jgi:hypothetical protein
MKVLAESNSGHKALAALLAALVFLTLSNSAQCGDAFDAARKCSEVALRRYALTSMDTAEKVAQAAFDKCADLWGAAAQELAGELPRSADPMDPANRRLIAGKAVERGFLAKATVEVFDIRAEAVGK